MLWLISPIGMWILYIYRNAVILLMNSCFDGEQVKWALKLTYMAQSTLVGWLGESRCWPGTWRNEGNLLYAIKPEERSPCGGRGTGKRRRDSLHKELFSGWSPVWHSGPKKAGRQSKEKLLQTVFRSLNHKVLERLKITLFLHMNDKPFICKTLSE